MASKADLLKIEMDKLYEEFKAESPVWHSKPLHSNLLHSPLLTHHVRAIDLNWINRLDKEGYDLPLIVNDLGNIIFAFDEQFGAFLVRNRACWRRRTYTTGWVHHRLPNGKVHTDLVYMCAQKVEIDDLTTQEIDDLLEVIKGWWTTSHAKRKTRARNKMMNFE